MLSRNTGSNNTKMICYTFLVILLASSVKSEMFTALADLEKVLYAERDIAHDIREYVTAEEARLETLKRIATDYEQHSIDALEQKERYLANPINAYLLVKRFTVEWNDILNNFIHNNTVQDLLDKVMLHQDSFPSGEDLTGAMTALLRLQDTYQLPASKIASGNLGAKVKDSATLSASDCYELGQTAYSNEDFYHTILWMEETLDRIKAGDTGPRTLKQSIIFDYLAFAYYRQGNIKHALNLTEQLLQLEPEHERAANNKRYYESLLASDEFTNDESNRRKLDDYRRSEEFRVYEQLCRGEETHVNSRRLARHDNLVPQPRVKQHLLKCRYVDNNHPWLMYQPIKEETVHLKPWIVIYHDVMSDSEIARIKSMASPRLHRATVQNAVTGELEFAQYRISKSAWLKGEDDPVCQKINHRIEALTGLNMDTAEELQVVNYGIGGHYEPHFDFARPEEKEAFKKLGTGNRVATFIFYMSDVDAGGATVFPYIGVKLWPKKGAAGFWYNLYKNGDGDFLTRHAACPVLTGSKWVCNKWIHERGQEFRRPCGVDPEV